MMDVNQGAPGPASADGLGGLDEYLGAARVVRVFQGSLQVALEEPTVPAHTRVQAIPALTFPYQPVVGDQLLVIGDAHAFYAIGVLSGRGSSVLSNPRGVSLRAEGGRLRLAGERALRMRGSRIRVEAERLRQLAVEAVFGFGERTTRVRDGHKVEAGSVDELSQRHWMLQAGSVVMKALLGARIKSTTVRVG